MRRERRLFEIGIPGYIACTHPAGAGRMDQALEHFNSISGFGRSALLLVLILAANFAITGLHSFQEWKGRRAAVA